MWLAVVEVISHGIRCDYALLSCEHIRHHANRDFGLICKRENNERRKQRGESLVVKEAKNAMACDCVCNVKWERTHWDGNLMNFCVRQKTERRNERSQCIGGINLALAESPEASNDSPPNVPKRPLKTRPQNSHAALAMFFEVGSALLHKIIHFAACTPPHNVPLLIATF